MSIQKPAVGRIVHYQSYGTPKGEYLPEPRAAVITAIPELLPEQPNSGPEGYVPSVSLAILNPTGMFFNEYVPYADEPTPGHWNWPPRV
ncbi:hypothetical protein J4T99_gp118 [Mycobacterium phage Bromden]|uniref:Uncharacterized protein n=1 Tax=Mycobacterium phage Bromden TaxID=2283252 RepID=A0A345MBP3_9CAUD|nr:hypothetical protein J4T99_gp118 [Mycobacterium phage Bromden]AXH67914.1 hypothetical protein SEA_BROMDEN_112 [Mycobacterium phage Bromden]